MSKYLKKLETGESYTICSTSGVRTVAKSQDIFHGINMSFEKYASIYSDQTKETFLNMYEIIKGSTFKKILMSLEVNYKNLFFTQDQVVQFCKEYPNLMSAGWTCIPFLVGNLKKIAFIRKNRDELTIHEGDLRDMKVGVFEEGLVKDILIVPLIKAAI